jgi:predicted Zn-dependent protease
MSNPSTVEDVTVNGFPGATAAAMGAQWEISTLAL